MSRPGPVAPLGSSPGSFSLQPPVHASGMARPTAHDVRPRSMSSVWRPLEKVVLDCPIAGRSMAAASSMETEARSPIKRTAKRVRRRRRRAGASSSERAQVKLVGPDGDFQCEKRQSTDERPF